MSDNLTGAIDCDVHPALANTDVLLPYLDDYWREMVQIRTVENLDLTSYPPAVPLAGRPDWRPQQGKPGQRSRAVAESTRSMRSARASRSATRSMAGPICRTTISPPRWRAPSTIGSRRNGSHRDPRLRASIVIAPENPELAVDEINRIAPDKRFVQILVLAAGERPLGKRTYWPIYRAAAKHGLPIGIHAGSSMRHPPTSLGWGSYYLEDYVAHAQSFQHQVLSLVAEGVFVEFPALKAVLIESGITWLPAFLWRFDKTWRGIRTETPWVDRPPTQIVRDHIRLTLTAGRRAAGAGAVRAAARPYRLRGHDPVLDRLSALAIRGRRRVSRWLVGAASPQDNDRQSVGNLSAPCRRAT